MNRKLFLAFLVFIIVILCVNFWLISEDRGEMHRSESFKFFIMHSYYSPNQNAIDLDYYPPGYFILPVALCRLLNLPFNYNTCLLPNAVYFILTIIGLFILAKNIVKNDYFSVLSCLMLTSFPLFFYCTKKLFMEIALVPWVIFAVYAILINKNWQNYAKAVLFGVISGVGLIFKWTFLLYISGPVIISVLYTLKNNLPCSKKRVFFSLLLSGFIAFIICGWWYVERFSFGRLLFHLDDAWATATGIDASYWSFLRHNIFMTARFLFKGISYPIAVILLLCIIWHWRKIKLDLNMQIIISWFLLPFIALCAFIGDSQPRYLLPIIPALAILMVILIHRLPKSLHALLSLMLILLCVSSIIYQSVIYYSDRAVRQRPLNSVIQNVLSGNQGKQQPLSIGFNGLYDSVTCNEVFDAFVIFWSYMVNDNLHFDMRYLKKREDLRDIRQYDYIVSQQTRENRQLHAEIINKGYDIMLQFHHHYLENSDPLCDWESDPDYIIFRRIH